MKIASVLGLSFLYLLRAVSAHYKTDLEIESSILSCIWLAGPQQWQYQTDSGYYATVCNYEPAFGTWLLCIKDNSVNQLEIMPSIVAKLNKMCSTYGVTINETKVLYSVSNATKYVNDETMNGELATPMKFDLDKRSTALNTAFTYLLNKANCNKYAFIGFYYLAIVFLAGALWHKSSHLRQTLLKNKICSQIRSKLVLPAIHEKHATPRESVFGGLVPTRLESLIVFGYLLSHIVALGLSFRLDCEEFLEPRNLQILRFIGDRTGILSFAHLPLIFLFSGRNSFLENFAGMKYTTSIVLHKYIGRFMALDAIVHMACYFARAVLTKTINLSLHQNYWLAGVFASICIVLICIQSVGKVRHKMYEIFVLVHIILSLVFLYFCFQHVKPFGWTSWLYVSICIWCIEKLTRLTKIWRNGGYTPASVEVISSDLIKLVIPKPRNVNYGPSQYIFLYVLWPSAFFQSHPFTCFPQNNELIVIIKAKNGLTKKLVDFYTQSTEHSMLSPRLPLLIEGPYGPQQEIKTPTLFICGGSGIPGPLSHLESRPNFPTKLVYVAPTAEILLSYPCLTSHLDQMQIYLTREHRNDIPFPYEPRRPDLTAIIDNFIADFQPVCVVSCGPPQLVDEVRAIIAPRALYAPIEYIEEFQTW